MMNRTATGRPIGTRQQRAAVAGTGYTVEPHDMRYWALRDGAGELVCITVYLRGAAEVARRLARQ